MENNSCTVCDGQGWVCENHMDKPWKEFSEREDACDCGAGAPCVWCNPCDKEKPPKDPPGFKINMDVENGHRH